MSSISPKLVLCIAALALVPDCSSEGGHRDGELAISQAALIPGVSPLPVSPSGPGLSWDGTRAELLAADALAQCWISHAGTYRLDNGGPTDSDEFLKYLATKMGFATEGCNPECEEPPLDATATDIGYCAWLEGRANPTCNVDAVTQEQPAALSVAVRDEDINAYILPLETLQGPNADRNQRAAQDEILYADLNLCIAKQLEEKLQSLQVAFSSPADLEELQEIVRERALTAVYQYALLAKTFAIEPDVFPTFMNAPVGAESEGYYAAAGILARGASLSPAHGDRLGSDFLTAVNLLIQSTEDAIELQMRAPSGQKDFGTFNPSNQGMQGPRVEILDGILYDDPRAQRRAVQAEMSAPEVGVLLGLARKAAATPNSLALRVKLNGGTFNRLNNARNLLVTVENDLRQGECTINGTNPCPLASDTTPEDEFKVTQRYGIKLPHAYALSDALATAVLGPARDPNAALLEFGPTGNTNPFVTAPPFSRAHPGPAQGLTMHLIGAHSTTGNNNPPNAGFRVAPDFQMLPLSAADLQSSVSSPIELPPLIINAFARTATIVNDAIGNGLQGFGFRRAWIADSARPWGRRPLGTNTVLSLAREALVQLGNITAVGRNRLFLKAAPAIDLIAAAVGDRQVAVRPRLVDLDRSEDCDFCSLRVPEDTGTTYALDVDIIAKASAPPSGRIGIGAGVAHAATAALSPTFHSFWDTTQTSLNQLTYQNPSPIAFAASGYELRTTAQSPATYVDSNAPHGATVVLRRGNAGDFTYEHVLTSPWLANIQAVFCDGCGRAAFVTFGGRLGSAAERAWAFDVERWSSPRFDAFGLPRDWLPAGDASLQLEPGVSVERHFLSRAQTAAAEATAALQTAFDTLSQEAIDQSALSASEARASELNKIELQALCGAATPCTPAYVPRVPVVPPCGDAGPSTLHDNCEMFRGTLTNVVGAATPTDPGVGVLLAQPVDVALGGSGPTVGFDNYKGGRLQSLFQTQLNAWKDLAATLATAVSTYEAAASAELVALAEYTAAYNALHAVPGGIQDRINKTRINLGILDDSDPEWQSWLQFTVAQAQLDAQMTASFTAQERACGDQARAEAEKAAYGYNVVVTYPRGKPSVETKTKTSYNEGPILAQQERCAQAKLTAKLALDQANVHARQGQLFLDALDKRIKASQQQQELQDTAEVNAAQDRLMVADRRVGAARAQVASQSFSTIQLVQREYGQLFTTLASIDEAYSHAELSAARIRADQTQREVDARTRFGLRKKYHSFDLWRARALSENARRLAVAARRAIEGRYAVDLSQMTASEAFVAAPSLWADEIYGSDLGPPVAVGLTRSPTTQSGVYTNKLVDYVNNLRLFADGFAIRRPSAQVRSDAEVIHLPGPAAEVVGKAFNADFAYIDPESTWSFYCAGTKTWIRHPNAGTYSSSSTVPTWSLKTACPSADASSLEPPTRAQIAFSLDPWGRLNRWIETPPFVARYNVRSGNLAVNLVGTGIRDCEKARDRSACYAEPFVRYHLEHVGPAWVSDYDQKWKGLDIAHAVVEGGKALAAELWLDPVTSGFNRPDVANVTRMELHGRPVGGAYELTIDLTPEIRVEKIERIQVLLQTEYWVRQKQ